MRKMGGKERVELKCQALAKSLHLASFGIKMSKHKGDYILRKSGTFSAQDNISRKTLDSIFSRECFRDMMSQCFSFFAPK